MLTSKEITYYTELYEVYLQRTAEAFLTYTQRYNEALYPKLAWVVSPEFAEYLKSIQLHADSMTHHISTGGRLSEDLLSLPWDPIVTKTITESNYVLGVVFASQYVGCTNYVSINITVSRGPVMLINNTKAPWSF